MSSPQPITLILDRRLLEHPRAYHLRRMRAGIWLYLDLLARLPGSAGSIEIEPAAIAVEMGLPEGTIRSWLGHLRKAGYLEAKRLNGKIAVQIDAVEPKAPSVEGATGTTRRPIPLRRFFTVPKLARALGEAGQQEAFKAALDLYPDEAIKVALAGALAVPGPKIRKSRTALFLYLLKHPQP